MENRYVSNFIYFMVIVLCVVIFTELSLGDILLQPNLVILKLIFKYVNLALLVFFCIEIFLRIFSEGIEFFKEFVNVFDSAIVFVSFGLNISGIEAKFIGILRVLRLVKVIIQMKKNSDEKRAKKLMIKEEKKK